MSDEIERVPEVELIEVPKAQLQAILQRNKDLMTLFESSVDMMFCVSELMGGKLPQSTMEMISAIPKIMKKVKNDEGLIQRFSPVIQNMQRLAPQFMSQEMQNEFAKRFPAKEIKSLTDGGE